MADHVALWQKRPENLFLTDPKSEIFINRAGIDLKSLIINISIVAIALVFLVYYIVPFVCELLLLALDTTTTKGSVTKMLTTTCYRGVPCHSLTYEFELNGQHYSRQESVDTDNVAEGDPVTITYAISMPSVFHLGEGKINTNGVVQVGISICVFVAILLLVVRKQWQKRCLLRAGKLIFGDAVRIFGEFTTKGNLRVTVDFEFKTPRLNVIRNTKTAIRYDLKSEDLPEKASIAVLYIDDAHYMVL